MVALWASWHFFFSGEDLLITAMIFFANFCFSFLLPLLAMRSMM